MTQEFDEKSILRDLDLRGLDRLLQFDELGNVKIKSDRAGTFLVKLQRNPTFWQRLQEEFVRNELLWETDSSRRETALRNVRAMFDALAKLLMVFDEDLMDTLLGHNFFSTFCAISQFVLDPLQRSSEAAPDFAAFKAQQEREGGPLFLEISEAPFRERLFKMKFLYTHFLSSILPETKNETLAVALTRPTSAARKRASCCRTWTRPPWGG